MPCHRVTCGHADHAGDANAGLVADYELKLNSYDLSVDIELNDIVQRLRFEHPEVRAVVLTGGIPKVFCASTNIQMLAGSTHHHKVNFCKFTNGPRIAIEDATENSHQVWLAAVNGTAAGGGCGWRWRATRYSSSTTAPQLSRFPRSPFWPSCLAPGV